MPARRLRPRARNGRPRASQVAALDAPPETPPHAFLERDGGLVAELGLGLADHAGDGLVHLREHVDLLVVATERLDRAVQELGDVADHARKSGATVGDLLAELALQQPL